MSRARLFADKHGLTPCYRGWVLLICVAVAAGIDWWLVVHDQPTISEDVWAACATHPTLITAGTVAASALGWAVRRSWPLAVLAGGLWGHLFLHG